MQIRSAGLVGGIATAAMTAAVVYGMASGGFVDEFRSVVDAPWGRVTLIDLAAGLLLIGAWIGWRERSVARAAPWWIAMVVTGNLASGLYVIRAAWAAPTVEEFLLGARR